MGIELPAPPAGSKAQGQVSDGEVRITLPPRGMRFGRKTTGAFAIYWFVVTSAVTTGAVLDTLRNGFRWPWLAALGLWAVQAALVAAAFHAGRERAAIRASRVGLAIETAGPLGHRLFVWRPEEIADIAVAPRPVSPKQASNAGLLILHAKGPNRLFFVGRDPVELDWLAAILCRALGR